MAKVDQLFWPRYQSVRIIIILMRYARLKSKSTGIRVVQVDKMTFANAMLILIWGKSWNYLYSISSSRWRPPEDKKLKNLLSKIQQKPEKLLKFVVDSFFCWDLFQPLFAETRDEHIFFEFIEIHRTFMVLRIMRRQMVPKNIPHFASLF